MKEKKIYALKRDEKTAYFYEYIFNIDKYSILLLSLDT